MFKRGLFASICSCGKPNQSSGSSSNQLDPYYANSPQNKNDSLLDFPMSSYIYESDEPMMHQSKHNRSKMTPIKQSQFTSLRGTHNENHYHYMNNSSDFIHEQLYDSNNYQSSHNSSSHNNSYVTYTPTTTTTTATASGGKVQIMNMSDVTKNQQEARSRIGDSEFIMRRKTPSMLYQDKVKMLESVITPIKEDLDNEDIVSQQYRQQVTKEMLNLSISSQQSKLSSIPPAAASKQFKLDQDDLMMLNLDLQSSSHQLLMNDEDMRLLNLNIPDADDYEVCDGSPLIRITDGSNNSFLLMKSRQSSANFDKLKNLDTTNSPLVSPSMCYGGQQSLGIILEQCEVPTYDQHLVQDDQIHYDDFNAQIKSYMNEEGLISYEGIKLIISTANSVNGLQRREHFAMSQYNKLNISYKLHSADQFDKNLNFLLTDILNIPYQTYQQSLAFIQSHLSDRDYEAGLIEPYDSPNWLTLDQAQQIERELEDYIMDQWSNTPLEIKQLQLSTDQLLQLLRYLGEDLIYEKYGIEIDSVYNVINKQHSNMVQTPTENIADRQVTIEDVDNQEDYNLDQDIYSSNDYMDNQQDQNTLIKYASQNSNHGMMRLQDNNKQLAIYTIVETEESNLNDSSFLNSSSLQ